MSNEQTVITHFKEFYVSELGFLFENQIITEKSILVLFTYIVTACQDTFLVVVISRFLPLLVHSKTIPTYWTRTPLPKCDVFTPESHFYSTPESGDAS